MRGFPMMSCAAGSSGLLSVLGAPGRAVGCAVLLVMTLGCSDEDSPYYVVDTPRTPILQLLQRSGVQASEANEEGCVTLLSGAAGAQETWCQQFPLRPGQDAMVRFVLLAPQQVASLDLQVTQIAQLSNLNPAARASRLAVAPGGATATVLDPAVLALEPKPELTKVLLESPLRLEERYFSMRLPDAESLLAGVQERGALPAFSLDYEAKAEGRRTDKGFVTFVVLPEPDSPVTQAIVDGSLGGQPLPPEQRTLFLESAKSNVPPHFTGLTPDGGVLRAQGENRLELNLAEDPDPEARSRIQWFVSSGEVTNAVSRRPKWKPKATGPVAAFAMVRDLQGGSDFVFRTFEAQ